MTDDYVDLLKSERKKAGLRYDESKTVWEQLFKCPAQGCIVRTIYFKIFNEHVDADIHCYSAKEGLRYPSTKPKVIEEEEE